MFRISILELAFTCALILLVLVVPIMVARFQARMDGRLKDIEKKLDNKKQQ